MPQISVIVPVYKVEPYLDRCVKSVLNQTFSDFELILVDDGSPDACPRLCDEWATKDNRIQVIHKENGGLSDARNVGFDASAGEWITFVDSDDYIHPQTLEALYQAVTEHNVNVSICSFVRTKGEPLELTLAPAAKLWSAEDFYREQNDPATVAWGKLYHRSVVLPYPKGKLHEDEFVTYRILFGCEKIAVVDAPLYGYYQNPDGIIRSTWSARRIDVLLAYEEQIAFFTRLGKTGLRRLRIQESMKNVLEQLRLVAALEKPDPESVKTLEKWGRKILWVYRKDKVFAGEKDMWIYKRFYPRLTGAYLLLRAAGNKLVRRK